MRKGLGRFQAFDPRNLNYLIEEKLGSEGKLNKHLKFHGMLATRLTDTDNLEKESVGMGIDKSSWDISVYHWDSGFWVDQGNSPKCTGAAGVHVLADGPVTQEVKLHNAPFDFNELYTLNQENDRKMGYNYSEGASTLAMCQSLKQLGFVTNYYWGYNLNSMIQALRYKPVSIGINWYSGMDDPDPKYGIIRVSGSIRGGHEIEVNGINLKDGLFRLKQSWGREFGKRGHVYIPFKDMERLIAEDGDVVFFDEVRR